MKKATANTNGKLKLGKNLIARLNVTDKQAVKGGMRRLAFTDSVCGEQCCDTDHYTNCASRAGVCW